VKEKFRTLKLLQIFLVAEFTNEAGKSFKAKLPKNFNTKKEAEDFLNKNIGSTYKGSRFRNETKNHQLVHLPLRLCNKK
jgi:hypothetical protein